MFWNVKVMREKDIFGKRWLLRNKFDIYVFIIAWWMIFQKRVVRFKLDIYVVITITESAGGLLL